MELDAAMRMIPHIVDSSTESAAERKVFRAMQDLDMPNEWCCLHSVNLPAHLHQVCGEADFVIVGPGGIFVLEVKGGGISCYEGIWSHTNRYGQVARTSRSPFQQADSAMRTIASLLSERFTNARVTGPDLSRVLLGYGVVFPDCSFTVDGLEWEPETILDERKFRQPDGVKRYLEKLVQHWHRKIPGKTRTLDSQECSTIVKALRPSFELSRGLWTESQDVEARIARCTDDQYRAIDAVSSNQRLLIYGGAGTGKTFLAAEVARRHAAANQRVLFVCLSPLLARFLSERIISEVVEVRAVNEFMLDTVRMVGQIPDGFGLELPPGDRWFRDVLAPAFERSVEVLGEGRQYDVLIIDEAQDILNMEYLFALSSTLRGGIEEGTWRIFFDHLNQGAIYRAMDETVVGYLRSISTQVSLKQNVRNTHETLQQVMLITGADFASTSTGPGPPVMFDWYDDTKEASEKLASRISKLLKQGVAESEITILSPLKFVQSCASLLSSRVKDRITRLDTASLTHFPPRGITFASIGDFKGLENQHILLVDVTDIDSDEVAVSLVYVGMSRARVSLWMLLNSSVEADFAAAVVRNSEKFVE